MKNFFIQSSYLRISRLFSTPSNFHIVDTGYPQRICSHTFVVDEFFKIIFTSFYCFNQRLKICINNRVFITRFLVLINPYYLSAFKQHHNTTQIFIFTNVFWDSSLLFALNKWLQFKNKNQHVFLKLLFLIMLGVF